MSGERFTTTQLTGDDRLLLQRLAAGDANAIAAIERRYGDELRLFSRRMLGGDVAGGEDVVQDVFATCCEVTAESAPRHSMRGWLYQIARRRCIDVIRKRRDAVSPMARDRRSVQPSFDHAVDPCTTPAGRTLKRERAMRILGVLDNLDDELRSVVVMRFLQDLSREEIAEATGLTLRTVKTRISEGMRELRHGLDRLGDSTIR